MSIPHRDFSQMDEGTLADRETGEWIAVLPLGAHEQHGPHLPFETDTVIAQGIADRVASALPEDFPVTFLPAEPVGYSIEHMDFEGSQTLTHDEAIERWCSIGEWLAAFGISKLLLLNAHGGNSPLMTIVATELRVRCNLFCVATSWTRFLEAGDVVSTEEKAYGIHGGDIETSVMLALAPDKVDMNAVENFPNFQEKLAEQNQYLRAYGPHAFGWKAQDLNEQGVTGDASQATAEKGEALIGQAVSGLVVLLQEMQQFDLSQLK